MILTYHHKITNSEITQNRFDSVYSSSIPITARKTLLFIESKRYHFLLRTNRTIYLSKYYHTYYILTYRYKKLCTKHFVI